MENKNKLHCKACGNEDDFYMKCSYKGKYFFNIDGNGEPTENSEMYDGTEDKYDSKFIYCTCCNRKVGKIEEHYEI